MIDAGFELVAVLRPAKIGDGREVLTEQRMTS